MIKAGTVCPRCKGQMFPSRMIDSEILGENIDRCVACGEWLNPIILKNRENPRKPKNFSSRQKKYIPKKISLEKQEIEFIAK